MRYAIIADIHEDVISLKGALKKIEKLKCDEVICLGDISGFSVPHYHYFDTRNAHECLRLVRENCKIIIAGNHDLHAACKTPKINPDFTYPSDWYDLDYHARRAIAGDRVWLYNHDELDPLYTNEDLAFLRTLPEYHVLEINDVKVFLSHFIFPNLTGSMSCFYSEKYEFETHQKFMSGFQCELSFSGHRHYAGLFVAADQGILKKRYNSRYQPDKHDCMIVPPVAGNRIGNGFCIFDTEPVSVKTKRI